MNPARKAFDAWKKKNPDGTVSDFARQMGYRGPDIVYRHMRGDATPTSKEKIQGYADILGWTPGKVFEAFTNGAA